MKKRILKKLSPLVCVLTVYAPIEITRIIVINEHIRNIHTDTRPLWQFTTEIIFIWVSYVLAMVLVYMLVRAVGIEVKGNG